MLSTAKFVVISPDDPARRRPVRSFRKRSSTTCVSPSLLPLGRCPPVSQGGKGWRQPFVASFTAIFRSSDDLKTSGSIGLAALKASGKRCCGNAYG